MEPTGQFLYVEPNDNDVQAYRVDSTTGALTTIGTYSTGTGPVLGCDRPRRQVPLRHQFRRHLCRRPFGLRHRFGRYLAGIGTFATGSGPLSVTLTANGKFAYVANHTSSDISGYTLDTNGALTPVSASSPFPAGASTDWVAVDPSSRFAYAVNFADDTLSAYEIAQTGAPAPGVLTQIAGSPFDVGAGKRPRSLAVQSDRKLPLRRQPYRRRRIGFHH